MTIINYTKLFSNFSPSQIQMISNHLKGKKLYYTKSDVDTIKKFNQLAVKKGAIHMIKPSGITIRY